MSVERHPVGRVFSTAARPGEDRLNRTVYLLAAFRADHIRSRTKDHPGWTQVILDAGPDVRTEHVVGVLSACREAGIEGVEFTGLPSLQER